MSKDYYNILGIDRNASQEEIKRAFRKKAHQYHPDKAGGDAEKFKEVNEAYQVLGNPEKRRQYDQFGSAFEQAQASGGFRGFEGFRDFSDFANGFNINFEDLDFGDIFSGIGDIFGFKKRREKERQKAGADIHIEIEIDFLEAVFGVEKEISLYKTVNCEHCQGKGAEPGSKIDTCKRCRGSGSIIQSQRTFLGSFQIQSTCPDCAGEGKTYSQKCSKCLGTGLKKDQVNLKVKIPAGIDDGQTIRLAGQGQAGSGGLAGDLYITIKVKPDKKFRRKGNDIISEEEISFSQAALGDKIPVKTLEGKVILKIPAGTQSGQVFILRGKGITKLQGRGRGNHLVRIIVKTPSKLNRKQKKLFKELRKLE